jgi:predicted nucleic acid-binding protein
VYDRIIIDASAMVDYLVRSAMALSISARIEAADVHVPAHFDAEVLSALGRLHRANALTDDEVEQRLELTATAPFERHLLGPLLPGAWRLRHNLRLVDALYVELSSHIRAPIITTDAGLATATSRAELVGMGPPPD